MAGGLQACNHLREGQSLFKSQARYPARYGSTFRPCTLTPRRYDSNVGRRKCGVKDSRGQVDYERDQWRETASYDYPPPGGPSRRVKRSGGGSEPPSGGMSGFTKALIAGSFVIGLGAGVYFTSEVNVEPSTVASTQLVDQQTPSSSVCMANGYSSMVFDQRIFVSFNPFNVYVTQPEVKPGCILRRSNVNVLEKRGLVKNDEVDMCKKGMNTFAYVGDLENQPEVSCVYHSEDAENQFIVDPKKAVMGDGFRPKAGR